ncbi:MAG: hydrogenase iron-sulfur subunit [Mariprofundaceae bacterium]|nr:hydrogenase iron-sulfur subunit [Mariprofundaceae bacterium]
MSVRADLQTGKKIRAKGVIARLSRAMFLRIEAWLNTLFGSNNPLYHLGDLGFYFFYIMLATGTYLFFYYESTVSGSFDTLEYLTNEQWYLGGVMRSLHRYAADGMVLVMALHILREMVLGHFRGARWFSWVTGVPLLVMVYLSGIIGFWMVWDKLGQFIAVRTSEWLDVLPVFASPMARNFLFNSDMTDTFFRLLLVMHIGVPLFLLAAMLVHIKRVSHARIMPPAGLATGTLAALLLLSLLQPTIGHDRASLDIAVSSLNLDWFYMFAYPLMDIWSMGAVWALLGGVTLLLFFLPLLPPRPASEPVAAVNLDYCSGCGLCADDCPYEAISMQQRSDGHSLFRQEAHVIAGNCVQCGICTGACPSSNPFRHATAPALHRAAKFKSAIEMPQWSVDSLRATMTQSLDDIHAEHKILLFGCACAIDVQAHATEDIAAVILPCIGMLPPAFVEHALLHGADGVLVTGCREGDCYHRLGNSWLRERLDGTRRPYLRRSVDRKHIDFCWAAPPDERQIKNAIDAMRRRVRVR